MKRGYAAIGLHRPKSPANVGGVLRAAGCYGAAMVALGGERYKRWPTDTRNQWKNMPLIEVDDVMSAIPVGCVAIAVDLLEGARNLVGFIHPERAYYIFGPEDGTLGPEIVGQCDMRVMVPTNGCMNLAATVNVILYDRLSKQERS